ncbi:MAG: PmoA family protein [Bryobacteraceae bacterium]|nr:PmoA family protein [Bryobacteraceae bacterium]
MKRFALLLVAALPLAAQVKFSPSAGKIDIEIDGKPFSAFFFGDDAPKPYLHPLRMADGLIVSRHFPMEQVAGETKDHPHHRGLWFTHGDVNKIDFWMNEKSSTPQRTQRGIITAEGTPKVKDGKKRGTIESVHIWKTPEGKPLLREERKMIFHSHPTLRMIDFDVNFVALDTVTWGDTKEGFFAIRLRDELTERKKTGKMISSTGAQTMKEIWGKSFPWVDYSGTAEGKKVGVAILEHPKSFRAPTYWHARDYGLFATNPFGLHDFFNDKTKDGSYKMEPKQSIRFRFRVVLHPEETAQAGIDRLFAEYARTK